MRFIYLLIITGSILFAAACRPAAPPVSISESPISNNRMPRLNLPMPPTKPLEKLGWTGLSDGKSEIMDDYKGKVLILDFWATYCPPCIEGIPHLRQLNKKYGDNLVVIGLHVGGEDDRPLVPAFKKRYEIDYLIATPEDELIFTLLGNDSRIPQTLVFDREGKLVKKFVSFDSEIAKQIDAAVEETINK